MQPFHHQPGKINVRLGSAEKRDLDDAALDRGRVVIAFDVIAADHIENDIGAGAIGRILCLSDKIVGLVIDGAVGAELEAGVGLLLRSDGDDHFCAKGFRKLDRHGADAGRAAMDQERLAGLKPAAFEHVVPDRHQGFRDGAGFLDRQRGRHCHGLGVLRDAILRVAAARDQRHHLVAELVPAGAGADRDDFACNFKAGQIAGAGRRRVRAGSLRDVGPVDAGSRDLDQDFARPGAGHRAGFGQKYLWAAGLADGDHGHLRGQLFHDLSLAKCGRIWRGL